MIEPISRRALLRGAAGAAAAFAVPGCLSAERRGARPGEKLNVAVIGVGNRGEENLSQVASENVVALCDVDANYLEKAAAKHPGARLFRDYREALALPGLHAAVISTADHTHAIIAAAALRRGLDVYCEKPLAHTVHEARALAALAREKGAITQMGIQIHDHANYRRVVELVQSGAIGAVGAVHVFCNGKNWSAKGLPSGAPPIPATLEYDLWLGPAASRPYHPEYHPASWRRYWAFGNGTLGDMACHTMDLAFWALNLTHPESVLAVGPPVDAEGAPDGLRAKYVFPSHDGRAAVDLHWYDGIVRPDVLAPLGFADWNAGVLFLGKKGHLIANYDEHRLGPKELFEKFTPPPPSIPDSPGHHREWIEACKTRRPTSCNFDYAARLTEAVLLGTVSYRCGQKLFWDPVDGVVTNYPEAETLLRSTYRSGWNL